MVSFPVQAAFLATISRENTHKNDDKQNGCLRLHILRALFKGKREAKDAWNLMRRSQYQNFQTEQTRIIYYSYYSTQNIDSIIKCYNYLHFLIYDNFLIRKTSTMYIKLM